MKKIIFLLVLCLTVTLSAQVSETVDPKMYLDKSVPKDNFTFSILPTDKTITYHFTYGNMVSFFENVIVAKLNEKGIDSSDIQWFVDNWKSTEQLVLGDNSYDNELTSYYNGSYSQDSSTSAGSSYDMKLNAYGKLLSSGGNQNYYDEAELSADYTASGGSEYNARSYGFSTPSYPAHMDIEVTVRNKRYKIESSIKVSPLVLDLNGDGVLEASKGMWYPHKFTNTNVKEFDINGDGFEELVEWVGPNDGLLLIYEKGKKVNGKNLFGDADGFRTGYDKLAVHDKNEDKKISGKELDKLSVWQDKNKNAKVDDGEIKTLAELNITCIELSHKKLVSNFVQDGIKKVMWDWYPVAINVKKVK